MDYNNTSLWKNSLDNDDKYGNREKREKLISSFIKARDNACIILDKIRLDFPNLTVHDINHVDALWRVASVIIGGKYEVNPLEGYVLGCAFLMHDAVLSYDAAGGTDHLREQIEWKDYYEDLRNDTLLSEKEILYETDFKTIRLLHARKAEELYHQLFTRVDGSSFYIIEDKTLREHYGEIICRIAGSHHWYLDDVEKLDTQLPVTSEYPQEWRINPLKLACILRCADAGHIDDGRAPDYLFELLKIHGVSRNHWKAQNRLSQLDFDINSPDKILIKSTICFKEEDFAAWNVAYDAIQVLDHELRSSNELLRKKGIPEFKAQSVCGANSREELSKYIQTSGWKPFDACVHISNVEDIIENLGGEKLYGKEHKLEIVLRELIQNSRDAIAARSKIDSGYNGSIHISIKRDDEGLWISVMDDGVGMSISTIKNYFLNFGQSFWGSDLAKREYPGLKSSGFKSIGQFGIGFYSIFMVASKVIVKTRKYDSSLDDNLVLKFPTGLSLSPIVSQERGQSNCSTLVEFLIDDQKCEWKANYTIMPGVTGYSSFEVPYSNIISHITAGIDVDVYYKEFDENEIIVHKNLNEIKEESAELLNLLKDITYSNYRNNDSYLQYIESNYKRLRKIEVDGKVYGFAALNTLWNSQCTFFNIETINGLANIDSGGRESDFLGILFNEPLTAKRETNADYFDRTKWAITQYEILCKNGLTDEDKLYLPYNIGKYGIDMTDIMTIKVLNKRNEVTIFNLRELIGLLAEKQKKLVIGLSSFTGSNHAEIYIDQFRSLIMLDNSEVLFLPVRNTGFLELIENYNNFPNNILWCIEKIGKDLNLSINMQKTDNKVVSMLGGNNSALVFEFIK